MKRKSLGRFSLILLLVLPYFLYCDFWQWNVWQPMVFGWIPWHMFYQILLNVLFFVAFTLWSVYAWPKDPEILKADDDGGEICGER